jgi:hypothetical protein
VEDLARRMGVKLYRTCVKDNILVNDVFEYAADLFLKKGGEAALGSEAVQSIGNIGGRSRKQDVDTQEQDNDGPAANKPSGIVSLEPTTRRTGGKKKGMCTIL